MPGRRPISEATLVERGYGRADFARRRAILQQTLDAFEHATPPRRFHQLAADNLARWRAASTAPPPHREVAVLKGDWGVVTGALTREHGVCFAALNMANAFLPGGAYIEGTAAQEENMFRRTDCHFQITDEEMDPATDRYRPETTRLLSASGGRVLLDTAQPRVCIRGPEDAARDDLGYAWLPDDAVFPFFELRAAAQDLKAGQRLDEADARARIAAQLDTLRGAGVRHAVLSAFGCGAFRNPAEVVARLYREEIARRRDDFALIAFAIFHPGYGPDNFTPFAEAFDGF